MIDFDRTLQFNAEWLLPLAWTKVSDGEKMWERAEPNKPLPPPSLPTVNHLFGRVVNDCDWDKKSLEDFQLERAKKLLEKGSAQHHLNASNLLEEEHILLPDRVFGFVLRTRKWGMFPNT